MKLKYKFFLVTAFMMICLCGCGKDNGKDVAVAEKPAASPTYSMTASVVERTIPPTEAPLPTETPKPAVKTAKIGFVGDIMIMESQVRYARVGNNDYNFVRCFEPMRELFTSVDLMCANLETPLAGENAIYSGPAPTVPPATEENPNPQKPFQTFNAPDDLAYDLKALGVDVLTTANNHCLDRGIEGLYRTIDVLRKANLYQTGTYKNVQDRNEMLIKDVCGIKVGILAYSAGFNTFDRQLSASELFAISKFYETDFVKSQIKQMRSEGADYIIVVPHCGTELSLKPEDRHVEMFRQFVEWGADAVVSSHPHVVQPIEFITVTRDNGEKVKAPIVYSLGNFISNMAPAPKNYGMFVSISIEKTEESTTTLDLEYTPVYCIRQDTSIGMLHQTLPCYEDELPQSYEPLSSADKKACEKCRSFVIDVCGTEYLSSK